MDVVPPLFYSPPFVPSLNELSFVRVLTCKDVPVHMLPHRLQVVLASHRREMCKMDLGRIYECGSRRLMMAKMVSALDKAPCRWSRELLARGLRGNMHLCAMALGDPDMLKCYLSDDNAENCLQAFHVLPDSKLHSDYESFERELEIHLSGKYRCLQILIPKCSSYIWAPIGELLISNLTTVNCILLRVAYASLDDWDVATKINLLALSGEPQESLFPQDAQHDIFVPTNKRIDVTKRIAIEGREDLYALVATGYQHRPILRMLSNVVWKAWHRRHEPPLANSVTSSSMHATYTILKLFVDGPQLEEYILHMQQIGDHSNSAPHPSCIANIIHEVVEIASPHGALLRHFLDSVISLCASSQSSDLFSGVHFISNCIDTLSYVCLSNISSSMECKLCDMTYLHRVSQHISRLFETEFGCPYRITLSAFHLSEILKSCRDPFEMLKLLIVTLGMDMSSMIHPYHFYQRAGIDRMCAELIPNCTSKKFQAMSSHDMCSYLMFRNPCTVLNLAFSIDTGMIAKDVLSTYVMQTNVPVIVGTRHGRGKCAYSLRDYIAMGILTKFVAQSTGEASVRDLMSRFEDMDWDYCASCQPTSLQVKSGPFHLADSGTWLEHYTRTYGRLLIRDAL